MRNRRKEERVQTTEQNTREKARNRSISNLQKQDSVLARRIKARVETAWSNAGAGAQLDHAGYIAVMQQLQYYSRTYTTPDEALESDCEGLWRLMLQHERTGVLCAPDHIVEQLLEVRSDTQAVTQISFRTFL